MSLLVANPLSINGAPFTFGVVAARYNNVLVDGLLEVVLAKLGAAGVKAKRLTVLRVAGSHEVPWAVHAFAAQRGCDCVLRLGGFAGIAAGRAHNGHAHHQWGDRS